MVCFCIVVGISQKAEINNFDKCNIILFDSNFGFCPKFYDFDKKSCQNNIIIIFFKCQFKMNVFVLSSTE